MRLRIPLIATGLLVGLAGIGAVACGTDGSASPPTPAPTQTRKASDTKRLPAPIESVSIVMLKSYPPQYVVQITSGLPSGCAKFDSIDWERKGDRIAVHVYNTVPANEQMACTMVYGYHESSVNIGSAFTPGTTYTVDVNGTEKTFTA